MSIELPLCCLLARWAFPVWRQLILAEPGAVLGDFDVIMFFTEGFASDGRKASRASAMAYALRLTQNVVVVAGKNHETCCQHECQNRMADG